MYLPELSQYTLWKIVMAYYIGSGRYLITGDPTLINLVPKPRGGADPGRAFWGVGSGMGEVRLECGIGPLARDTQHTWLKNNSFLACVCHFKMFYFKIFIVMHLLLYCHVRFSRIPKR